MYIAISQVMSEAWMANKEVWRAVQYPCGDHADRCKIHKCGRRGGIDEIDECRRHSKQFVNLN